MCAYVTGGQRKLFDHESNSGWDRGGELVYTPEKRFGCKYWQKFLTSECHFIAMTLAIWKWKLISAWDSDHEDPVLHKPLGSIRWRGTRDSHISIWQQHPLLQKSTCSDCWSVKTPTSHKSANWTKPKLEALLRNFISALQQTSVFYVSCVDSFYSLISLPPTCTTLSCHRHPGQDASDPESPGPLTMSSGVTTGSMVG